MNRIKMKHIYSKWLKTFIKKNLICKVLPIQDDPVSYLHIKFAGWYYLLDVYICVIHVDIRTCNMSAK